LADNLPSQWTVSIDDPAVPLRWPENLKWQRPFNPHRESAVNGGNPYHLFKFGWFSSHSGFQLPWKIDCEDGFEKGDWEALASIIAWKFAFSSVYGVPKGGVPLARALDKHCEPGYPVLIVDDVLTTGRSMEHARAMLGGEAVPIIGIVVFARGKCPDWVWPILTVNEWAQSRATGLG
jgi:hypothetical protein